MKNSIILMIVGAGFIVGGFLGIECWILNGWFLLVPIGGLAIFIKGSLNFIKNFGNGGD